MKNANQLVRELAGDTAMEIIVGNTQINTQEILYCWEENKHHLAALPLYPRFASLNFAELIEQHEDLYQLLLQLAHKARAVGPLLYFVVQPLGKNELQVTTIPQPNDKILFQAESENEAETWRWENSEKVVNNTQPPEAPPCSTS